VDPLLISAGIEASDFMFRIQLGFGDKVVKKQVVRHKLAGVEEKPLKFGTYDATTIQKR